MPNKAKEKTVNYTPEMTKAMIDAYTAEPTRETVVALSEQLGKSTRSIVAKLSREGVYKKAEYAGKNGERPETKEAKVEKIAASLGVTSDKLGGLEAATKMALNLILAALTAKETDSNMTESEGA